MVALNWQPGFGDDLPKAELSGRMLSSNSTPSIGGINTASNGNVMACDNLVIPSLAAMGPFSALAFPGEGALSFSD